MFEKVERIMSKRAAQQLRNYGINYDCFKMLRFGGFIIRNNHDLSLNTKIYRW